jgi:hypothetical protein
MKKNVLLNEKVLHSVFGIGLVIGQEDGMIIISFPEHGKKRFLYPNAFEKHLKMCNEELNVAVTDYLNQKKPEIEAERLHKQQLYEEDLKRQADEIAKYNMIIRKNAPKKKLSKVVK